MVILLEPCKKTEHEEFGYTRLVFTLDQKQNPIPKPENGKRVLFYGCLGCDDDRYKELIPQCPESHRPYRYFSQNTNRYFSQNRIGCHACDHYVSINRKPAVGA